MTPEDIRGSNPYGHIEARQLSDAPYGMADLVAFVNEIAAQLAELNQNNKQSRADRLAEPTLRDLFAMAVMQGDWAAQGADGPFYTLEMSPEQFSHLAKTYYKMADAILVERNGRSWQEPTNDETDKDPL